MRILILVTLVQTFAVSAQVSQPSNPSKAKTIPEIFESKLNHHDPICGNHALEEHYRSQYLQFDQSQKEENIHQKLVRKFKEKPRQKSTSKYQVPILFHFMMNNTGKYYREMRENFTSSRAESALKSLNNYFEDTDIQFCLATHYDKKGKITALPLTGVVDDSQYLTDITGNPSSLIYYPRISSLGQFDQEVKAATIIDSKHILNVWAVDPYVLDHSFFPLGYATFPDFQKDRSIALPGFHPDQLIEGWFDSAVGDSSNDGVMVHLPLLGSVEDRVLKEINAERVQFGLPIIKPETFQLYEKFEQGGVLAHEVGHYFGLFHTFGSYNSCKDGSYGDFVSDTPINYTPSEAECSLTSNGFESILKFLSVQDDRPKICQKGESRPSSWYFDEKKQMQIASNLMSYDLDSCKKKVTNGLPLTPEQILRINHTLRFARNRNLTRNTEEGNIFCKPKSDLTVAEQFAEYNVFPNPVGDGMVTIQLDLNNSSTGLIKAVRAQIIDAWGRVVRDTQGLHEAVEGSSFNMTGLTAGTYFLKVFYPNKQISMGTKKIIKH